ncbi:MAG: hypothetical protein IT582_03385 [Opitutaceae bacterium]|nr:hypothetical protein [Opitutaceae bacterium]
MTYGTIFHESPPPPPRKITISVIGLTLLAAALFALYTNHAWEDYYITFRSSQNLATGNGLVFNVGDRLHTFTSPIGVLLPALAYLLTGNSSVEGALWIFRFMSMAALAGAVAVLLRTVTSRGWRLAGIFLAACVVTDAKTLDFTINGMETAFMLLFLSLILRAHLVAGPRQALRLGAAWGGLMWTRPDGCVYIGVLALAFLWFHREDFTGGNRRRLLGLYAQAALVCTAIYLPWFGWAWYYYGSPIPHTIVAKSGIGPARTLAGLAHTLLTLPGAVWQRSTALEDLYLPSYFMIGGWPGAMTVIGRAGGFAASLLWIVPGLRKEARAASLACYGVSAYLTYFPYFPFPWYLPPPALLGSFSLALAGGQLCELIRSIQRGRLRRGLLTGVGAVAGLWLAGQIWATIESAREMRTQQDLIENGNRREIGVWLRDHAQPGDSVFLEPLGYIGFFSGLKTHDWPGMSSREMVAARKKVGANWATLIDELRPDWLVLRPAEAGRLDRADHRLLGAQYKARRTFDQSRAVAAADVQGKPYLAFDQTFTVYERVRPKVVPKPPVVSLHFRDQTITPTHTESRFGFSSMRYQDHDVIFAHAPSQFDLPQAPGLGGVSGEFGLLDSAWTGDQWHRSAGAIFSITQIHADGSSTVLFHRGLDPANRPEDRGFHPSHLTLPQADGASLRFQIQLADRNNFGYTHTFWGNLQGHASDAGNTTGTRNDPTKARGVD